MPLTIDLAVVHANPRLSGVWVGKLPAGSGRKIERVEPVTKGYDRPAAFSQRQGADVLGHVPCSLCAATSVAGVDLRAQGVDPIEPLLANVP